MREIAPNLRFLLSSGGNGSQDLPEEFDADQVLAKPYQIHQLTRAIRHVLEK